MSTQHKVSLENFSFAQRPSSEIRGGAISKPIKVQDDQKQQKEAEDSSRQLLRERRKSNPYKYSWGRNEWTPIVNDLIRKHKVIMFSKSNCASCKKAKQLFESKALHDYEVIEVN